MYLANLQRDPGLRIPILDYSPNIQDQICRAYLQKGPCQPNLGDKFPHTMISGKPRRFNKDLYDQFDWLEYSISKDSAFCLHCYLFKSKATQTPDDLCFTERGYKNWKHGIKSYLKHVGNKGSNHNGARLYASNLMNEKTHIEPVVRIVSKLQEKNYRIMLTASLDCVRFLLRQGLSFRGHDESATSNNRGNYLELLQFLADHDEKIKEVVLENASGNLKCVAPSIQKDLVHACACETLEMIKNDMKDKFFSLLVDESRDTSVKEQMAIVLRYVDDKGQVIERFVGVVHVTDTSANTLKESIDNFFSNNNLNFSKLRGQGYDGASNMRGEFNGLKTKILGEQQCAFYVHCFAHQLQLALVVVSKKLDKIAAFFTRANSVVTIIGASCKRRDALRAKQQEEIVKTFENDCLLPGRGSNQEYSLKLACDTRWNSHYGVLISIISMYSSIVDVLEMIVDDGHLDNLGDASRSLSDIQSFEFVFYLFVMKSILGVTNELSQALQKKDQEIVNAMHMVKACKEKLRHMRNNEFDLLLTKVESFCEKHYIEFPRMDEPYFAQRKSKRKAQPISKHHHYYVEVFIVVLDAQLMELDDRFNEMNTKLLICFACLSPNDSFKAFDKQKLIALARLYPQDFSDRDLLALEDQLDIYINHVRSDTSFSQLKGINGLAKKMVEKGFHRAYNYVYLLLTLALVLPVATASVERSFSAMNIVKTQLRNKMGDQWLSDSLVVYIEKNVFSCIENEAIMQHFQNMSNRRCPLPRL